MLLKGLRVNMPKTKIMISADGTNTLENIHVQCVGKVLEVTPFNALNAPFGSTRSVVGLRVA